MAGNFPVRNLGDELRQALAGEDEPFFDKLAADLRRLTKRRKQTPSEILLREGRDQR